MKQYQFFLFFFSFFFIQAQKIKLEYNVEFERQLTEKQRNEFLKNKLDAKFIADTYENPNTEYYTLKLSEDISELEYQKQMSTEDNKSNLVVSNFPMGKKSIRIKNDKNIYYEFVFENKKLFANDTLLSKNWIETKKDTIILKYKAKEIVYKNKFFSYKAWYVEDLPSDIGLFNLSYNKGFIIAYEFSIKEDDFFKKNIVKVYPVKQKKLKDIILKPEYEKLYTVKEIKKMFSEQNKKINTPVSN
jgi:GLPGLI family protein